MGYDVYAIKYAERDAVRGEHFIGGDPHDDAPMPMDYFVWTVIDQESGKAWMVDTMIARRISTAGTPIGIMSLMMANTVWSPNMLPVSRRVSA